MAASESLAAIGFLIRYLNDDGHAIAGLSTPRRGPAPARQC